ncbi:MAG: TetR/AcrR family transcriptional regulator [Clostridia bacterium]|nr:TetR/AcrR family transcriptional regulator [Clostridia bacterium]
MPPKERFTRNLIINAAYNIYLESGMDAVTTRSIAKAIDGSTQPVFSQFKNIEEVHSVILDKALTAFCEQNIDLFSNDDALLLLCEKVIDIAFERPHLLSAVLFNPQLPKSAVYQKYMNLLIARYTEGRTETAARRLCLTIFSETVGLATFISQNDPVDRDEVTDCLRTIYNILNK